MAHLFLTGGSGLLGQRIAKIFRQHNWNVVAPSHAELDCTDAVALNQALYAATPDLIINCAAQRNPDLCETDTPEIRALNILLPKRLAQTGLPTLHLSTDYVFNGANAPYTPDARRCPINAYGRQKMSAEQAIEDKENVLILRLPILYGPTNHWHTSAVTVLAANLLAAKGAPVLIDNIAIRYPTLTDDIARQLLAIAPSVGKKYHGIWHYSGEEPMTKFQMAQIMAPMIGCAITQCVPDECPPTVPRPYNCHLSTRTLQQTGLYISPSPFREAIARILK